MTEPARGVLAAIVRASLAHPRIVTALALLIAVLGAAALFTVRFDVFPDFAPPHVLVQTEAPGLDATQVEALVTRPLEGLLAGTENVKTRALDVEPGPVGDPGGVRPRRRSLPAAPGRDRTPGRVRRPAARGRAAAAAVAAELLDGVPGPLRLHQRLRCRRSNCAIVVQWIDQAADPCGARRRAGADLRRRSARAADRGRPAQARRGRALARRRRQRGAARDRADRRRLHRNRRRSAS